MMQEKAGKMRIEKDSMGPVAVPEDALYGATTQRALENFTVSSKPMPAAFIRSLGLLKYACAEANFQLKRLDKQKAEAIKQAAWEIYEGKLLEHFPIDVFQTGSATSTNMNCNEVIANRASQMIGNPIGSRNPLHPNDDVNQGQSSNDTMPTTLHVSVAWSIKDRLLPSLARLEKALEKKAALWKDVIKIGRTHLMDATPLTLGQEFSGYLTQIKKSQKRANAAIQALLELAIGGTAVGTGINTHPQFGVKVASLLSAVLEIPFVKADNHFEAQGGRDAAVEVAGQMNTLAASLTKIASDIRLMGSGPRCGFFELILPATQPGSSIMPGKTNPVMSEMLLQTCLYVHGLMHSVIFAGRDGQFELNVNIPLIAYCLLEAIECLSNAVDRFTVLCVQGLEANVERCKELVEKSLMLVTALTPHIGYDKAAFMAKKAYCENKTLRQVVLEEGLMDAATLDSALDPKHMIASKE